MIKQKTMLFVKNKTTMTLSIYDDDLRKLFRLPKRKGHLTAVVLDGQCVRVTFETANSKMLKHLI